MFISGTFLTLLGAGAAISYVLERGALKRAQRLEEEEEGEDIDEGLPPPSPDSDGWLGQLSGLDGTEKEVDRRMQASAAALVLFSGVSLGMTSLAFIGLPILGAAVRPMISGTFDALRRPGRLGVALLDMSEVLLILTGHFAIAAGTGFVYHTSRKLLLRTEDRSLKGFIDVFSQRDQVVVVLKGDDEVEVKLRDLVGGELVIVYAGQVIPVDGTVVYGEARVDERALTGEAQAFERQVGDRVLAATTVLEGMIRVEVEAAGSQTVAAQISTLLETTADFKSNVVSRGEQMVNLGAWPTLGMSIVAWPLMGVKSALALSWAGFGYHMRVGGPLGVLCHLSEASRAGVLVKDGRSLELLAEVDTVVFDKTGTLTDEIPEVGRILPSDGVSEERLLLTAAAAEERQSHPIARAILRACDERGLRAASASEVVCELGSGLRVRVGGHQVIVGSPRLMASCGVAISEALTEALAATQGYGSAVYVAEDGQLLGAIELLPALRSDARALVDDLRRRGMEIHIMSGDREEPTRRLAQVLQIEHVLAEVLPGEKADAVVALRDAGRSVCFIGDGINDAVALMEANVSISMTGASATAVEAASVVLMDGELERVSELFDIAGRLKRNLDRGLELTVVPGLACVAGVLFLHMGVAWAVVMYNAAFALAMLNGVSPALRALPAPEADPGEGTRERAMPLA